MKDRDVGRPIRGRRVSVLRRDMDVLEWGMSMWRSEERRVGKECSS